MINKNNIIEILKQCHDPEIPIDLWNLGLIYSIKIKKYKINIRMTLTTPGCTMGGYMAEDITKKIKDLDKNYDVQVDVTFDPPWEPTMMSDKGREMLGFNVKKNEPKEEDKNWE